MTAITGLRAREYRGNRARRMNPSLWGGGGGGMWLTPPVRHGPGGFPLTALWLGQCWGRSGMSWTTECSHRKAGRSQRERERGRGMRGELRATGGLGPGTGSGWVEVESLDKYKRYLVRVKSRITEWKDKTWENMSVVHHHCLKARKTRFALKD